MSNYSKLSEHRPVNPSVEIREALEKVMMEFHSAPSGQPSAIFLRSNKSESLLRKLGLHWPAVQQVHIERMLDHCRHVGFL